MPYRPNTYDHEAALKAHRERLYWLTLLSGLANIALIALYATGTDFVLSGVMLGGVIGSLVVTAFRGNTDDYYQALSLTGLRWMAVTVGFLALVLMPLSDRTLVEIFAPGLAPFATDSIMVLLIACLAFHAGYAFAYLRDSLLVRGAA
ncbi:hypothetical protein [Aurantiacibacter gangjinensis]|uniref:Uncharacterized protein n=1 Tax=Aurantiacibacter gangjinensis TaxID=502682 RepID=A0A0G9MQN0_9SPHN|nr:hypothetical protein [Aurantiacibacter gangjinensis]APE28718.1 hypothetical protein BMF35_a1889 [Aurantiacibacter gangjinensis]KLE32879.1 hypothetical protein AAW01_02340 [Aurantiacibacter gangjinensis]